MSLLRFFGEVPRPVPNPAAFAAWLNSTLRALQSVLENIGDDNFQNPATGDTLIKTDSLSWSRLKSTPPIDICLLACEPAVSSTSTTYVGIGPLFYWSAGDYPGSGDWTFEASMATENTSATASVQLYDGSTALATLTTTGTTVDRQVSDALTMPITTKDLFVRIKTSNSSYAAYCKGARLVRR